MAILSSDVVEIKMCCINVYIHVQLIYMYAWKRKLVKHDVFDHSLCLSRKLSPDACFEDSVLYWNHTYT